MSTTLEVKLRNAAQLNAGLTALLGAAGNTFRWYDMQAPQGMQLPTVEVLLVSAVPQYSTVARLWTSLNRVQFTIRDTDAERARSVEAALMSFLDTFNAMNSVVGSTSIQANQVLNRRQGGNAQTAPVTYWRTVDVYIYNNETI